MKLNSLQDVIDTLELAARVDMALPPVKVQGAKALWPDIRLSDVEKKSIYLMTKKEKAVFLPTQSEIDVWYMVVAEWIKFFTQTPKKRQQWAAIWLRSCGCRSKTIERHLRCGRTKVWYLYDQGLAHLLRSLRVPYTEEEIQNVEYYRPELVKSYPKGKISGFTKISLLKEWLAELEDHV